MLAEKIKTDAEKEGDVLSMPHPDPEVPDKAVRRRFTSEYKRRILTMADACTAVGDLGALLRREGLYALGIRGI